MLLARYQGLASYLLGPKVDCASSHDIALRSDVQVLELCSNYSTLNQGQTATTFEEQPVVAAPSAPPPSSLAETRAAVVESIEQLDAWLKVRAALESEVEATKTEQSRVAMKFGLTTRDLKKVLWAYPTYISDIKYMLA